MSAAPVRCVANQSRASSAAARSVPGSSNRCEAPGTTASRFVAATGFDVTEASGTRVAGTVDLGPDQHTPWGVVHGGVYCAVIEATASVGASAEVADEGRFAVGVNR